MRRFGDAVRLTQKIKSELSGEAALGAGPIYELAHLQEFAHSNLAGVGWGGWGWVGGVGGVTALSICKVLGISQDLKQSLETLRSALRR